MANENQTVSVTTKPKSESKLLWLSGILTTLSTAVAAIPAGREIIAQNPGWTGIVGAIGFAAAFMLRLNTTQPLR